MTEERNSSHSAIWKHLTTLFSRYLDEKTEDIRHHDVISDLAGRTELSGNYLSSIILANLIALLGLLTNSVAVVIGAMLISPLMGPIFSLGLAFAMGDLVLSRRAVRNIAISILITVFVAALFTLISPLKGATHEILARTRPNIYDLLIAVFAGTAGALALCTRKNYLFTTTGVAVATAVIPPLSVVGYGVGTWQLGMAVGGFLLFFTNLVAIVISSNVVFYILRFRGSMVEESRYPARRRFQILGTVLVIISIPLVVTLVTDIRKVNLTSRVESILKAHLNRQKHSRLTNVSISKENGKLLVEASINTVKYVDSEILKDIEKELTAQIGRPARLDLEQVVVRSGAVDPAPLRAVLPVVAQLPETLATLREKTMVRLNDGCRDIESYIKPYKIKGCTATFSDQNEPIMVTVTVARDYPFSQEEQSWLKVAMEKKLGEPLALEVDTVPLLPPITFGSDGKPDEASRKSLAVLKELSEKGLEQYIVITAPRTTRNNSALKKRELDSLKDYLVNGLAIPSISITRGPDHGSELRVTVEPDQR